MKTTIDRIDGFRRLWVAIVPKVDARDTPGHEGEVTRLQCPPDSQIWRWVSRFDDSVLEHGLGRLRSKMLQGDIKTADSAGRYLTAVLCAEMQRRRDTACNNSTDVVTLIGKDGQVAA